MCIMVSEGRLGSLKTKEKSKEIEKEKKEKFHYTIVLKSFQTLIRSISGEIVYFCKNA